LAHQYPERLLLEEVRGVHHVDVQQNVAGLAARLGLES